MEIKIVKVERKGGKAFKIVAKIGGIESCWVRNSNGEIYEIHRIQDAQILDETMYLPPSDYQRLLRIVHKIFSG